MKNETKPADERRNGKRGDPNARQHQRRRTDGIRGGALLRNKQQLTSVQPHQA